MFKKLKYVSSKLNYELIIWVAALIYFFFLNPYVSHFSICPLNNLGLSDYCLGCGLGKSLTHLMHFHIKDSFYAHPFGVLVFFILLYRIFKLLKYQIIMFKGAQQW